MARRATSSTIGAASGMNAKIATTIPPTGCKWATSIIGWAVPAIWASHLQQRLLLWLPTITQLIIKFPYNARFEWLKQLTLSENKVQVNDIKLAFKIFASKFRQI